MDAPDLRSDEDDTDAAWAQMELEEQRRRELEGLERCRVLAEELRRESAVFERESREFHERLKRYEPWL